MDVETLIEAAEAHGADSGADHEIGDLRAMLSAAGSLFSPMQFREFAAHGGPIHDTYAAALMSDPYEVMPAPNVEMLLSVAKAHGEESEPDMEAGDLQEFLRAAWGHLTPARREQLIELDEVQAILARSAPRPTV